MLRRCHSSVFRINTPHSTRQTASLLSCFSALKQSTQFETLACRRLPGNTWAQFTIGKFTVSTISYRFHITVPLFHATSLLRCQFSLFPFSFMSPFHYSTLRHCYNVASCNMAVVTIISSSVCAPCIGIAASQCFNSCVDDSDEKCETLNLPVPSPPLTATNNPHAFGYVQKSDSVGQKWSVQKETMQL